LPVAAYGLAPDTPEPEIVAHLFKLYADKVKGLDNPARKRTRRTIRRGGRGLTGNAAILAAEWWGEPSRRAADIPRRNLTQRRRESESAERGGFRFGPEMWQNRSDLFCHNCSEA